MLTYLTAGESHGPQLTAIVDGFPAGFTVDVNHINYQLERRQKGYGRGGRMKIERDRVEFRSGIRGGVTLGSPITIVIANRDWENWTDIMHPLKPVRKDLPLKKKRLVEETTRPRPGHADLPGAVKWNHRDMRNVLERASARETAARVAVGALARQILDHFDVHSVSHVVRIGDVSLPDNYELPDLDSVSAFTEQSEVRCLDETVGKQMKEAIRVAKKERDSLGGVVEVIVRGLPTGLGGLAQSHHRLDGRVAGAMMSIQSVKGVEIGLGFSGAAMRGSAVHDEIFYNSKGDARKKRFYRRTNNAGGLEGGITNGEDVIIRVAAKPISTLNRPLKTVDVKTKKAAEAMVERTDNCVIPALAVICENVAAWVFAGAFLEKFGSDNLSEIERNFQGFLAAEF